MPNRARWRREYVIEIVKRTTKTSDLLDMYVSQSGSPGSVRERLGRDPPEGFRTLPRPFSDSPLGRVACSASSPRRTAHPRRVVLISAVASAWHGACGLSAAPARIRFRFPLFVAHNSLLAHIAAMVHPLRLHVERTEVQRHIILFPDECSRFQHRLDGSAR
jgi:hypothetical protein